MSEPFDPAVKHANSIGNPAHPYSEGYVGEGSNRIHYVEAGKGPVVLFVHGFPSFWYTWFDQMEALKACRRVIAIDALGAGHSAKPNNLESYRIANLAKQLDGVIATLAPDQKITLVGHDWGGVLAWSYAENDAGRLDRLAVFSAAPFNLVLDLLANDPEQRIRSSYIRALTALDRASVDANQSGGRLYSLAYGQMVARGILSTEEGELFKQALSDPAAIVAGAAWYKANIPAFEDIELEKDAWPAPNTKTDVPTLLVRGAKDRTFVAAMGDQAKEHAAQLQVEMIKDVGHWTPFEDQAAAESLRRFLDVEKGDCR